MKFIEFLLKICFPPHCLACGTSLARGVICESCFRAIPVNRSLFCAHCGARVPDIRKICHKDAHYLLAAAGSYDNPVLQLLIHHLKFRGVRRAAEPLAKLLANYLADLELNTNAFILIPLPLHWRRRNERGFNQTEEITRYIVKLLPLQVRTDILVRNRHTKPQTETTSALKRRENILGCFSVAKPDDVAHKNILLLDDVTTSGATLGEAARVLKIAGARKIVALTVAKT